MKYSLAVMARAGRLGVCRLTLLSPMLALILGGCVSLSALKGIPTGEPLHSGGATYTDTRLALIDGRNAHLVKTGGGHELRIDGYPNALRMNGALSARILRVEYSGERSNIVIVAAEAQCLGRTYFFSIVQDSADQWVLGDCKTAPRIVSAGGAQIIDFDDGNLVLRYLYSDGRMLKQDLVSGTPNADIMASARTPRYNPGPPVSLMKGQKARITGDQGQTASVVLESAAPRATPRPQVEPARAPRNLGLSPVDLSVTKINLTR